MGAGIRPGSNISNSIIESEEDSNMSIVLLKVKMRILCQSISVVVRVK